MIANSIHQISGKENDTLAWDTIFKYFNYRHGKGNVGYTAGEKIAIKLSLVQSTDPSSDGGNINFTPPQTVLALLRQLVYKAGVDADNITFYDAMRSIPTSVTIRCKKEFPKVHFAGSEKGQYQEAVVRSTTTMHWSEPLTMEINGGNTAYLPTIITQASYIINLANLKGHHLAGITCCTKNHNGSFLSDGDPNTPHAIGMHCYFTVHDYTINGDPEWSFKGRDMGTYNCFVDVMGHKDLGEKTMLFIIDGLYSVPSEGVDNTHVLRWQQTPFNNHFSSSIFMSQDNVAIESVALDFFRTEQAINPNIIFNWEDGSGTHNVIYGNVDNYLHEAAQADNPTSGTVYEPNGDGVRISSLGVHEHWNNAKDKQYTRNLFVNGTGIELVSIPSNIVSNNKDTALNATFTISSGGNPVKNAKIVINGSNFFTNEFGKVTIENLKSKSGLQYKVSKNGYSDVSGQVDINENVDVNIELTVGIQIVKYLSGLEIFPNPFKTEVNIKYNIEKRSKVSISIYNTSGQLINTIVNKDQNIGNYIQKWVPSNSLLQGIYFVEISLNNIKSQSMKISYVK